MNSYSIIPLQGISERPAAVKQAYDHYQPDELYYLAAAELKSRGVRADFDRLAQLLGLLTLHQSERGLEIIEMAINFSVMDYALRQGVMQSGCYEFVANSVYFLKQDQSRRSAQWMCYLLSHPDIPAILKLIGLSELIDRAYYHPIWWREVLKTIAMKQTFTIQERKLYAKIIRFVISHLKSKNDLAWKWLKIISESDTHPPELQIAAKK